MRVWFLIAAHGDGVDDIPRLDPGVFRIGASGVVACSSGAVPDASAPGGTAERLSASSAFHEIPAGRSAEDVATGR